MIVAWTATDTWLVIEACTVLGLLTCGAFFLRARRRGLSAERAATYRRSLTGLAMWALLNAARLELHKFK